MLRTRLFTLALLAPSGEEEPRFAFADKYVSAFAEARIRNVPILLMDFDGWDSARGHTIQAFYEDPDLAEAAELAVLLLASQGEHESRTQIIDGTPRPVCGEFGGVSCQSHYEVLRELSRDEKVFAKVGEDGAIISPLFAVITPDREVLSRATHEQVPATLVGFLAAARKKLGTGLKRSDFRRLVLGHAEIERLLLLHEYASATRLCDELLARPQKFQPFEDLAALRSRLEQRAKELLERAESLWTAGQILDALLAMDDVSSGFLKLPSARLAAARLADWEKRPEARPHLAVLKADRAARALYQQGIDLDRAGDSKKALATLEKLSKQFPDSRFTDRSRSLLQVLRSAGRTKG